MPHKTGGKRPGDADGMAADIAGTEPNSVHKRTRLHGNVAPKRAGIDGELSAELHRDPRRLRTGAAAELRRTVSCDDHGRPGEYYRRRDGLVYRASDADESERGCAGYASVDPG